MPECSFQASLLSCSALHPSVSQVPAAHPDATTGAAADGSTAAANPTNGAAAPYQDAPSGTAAPPPQGLSREGSLAPALRRSALSSSEATCHLWDVPFEQLHLEGKIGEGAFGRVRGWMVGQWVRVVLRRG